MYHDALCQGRIIYKINYKYFYGIIMKNIAISSKKMRRKGRVSSTSTKSQQNSTIIRRTDDSERSSTTTIGSKTTSLQSEQQEQNNTINTDDTIDKIKRSLEETRSQIPQYIKSLNVPMEIADNYIDLQRNIIISLQEVCYHI
jgi:hypothetical protein